MLVTNAPSSTRHAPVPPEVQHTWSRLFEVLLWIGAVLLAFGVPLGLMLAAIFVSSYGISLPVEVRVP
jgi:hypothetical protein